MLKCFTRKSIFKKEKKKRKEKMNQKILNILFSVVALF